MEGLAVDRSRPAQVWRLQTGQSQRAWPRITCMETSELSASNTVADTDIKSLPNKTRDRLFCGYFQKM
jgi:hypothetical protein